jgi:hypothetical protein
MWKYRYFKMHAIPRSDLTINATNLEIKAWNQKILLNEKNEWITQKKMDLNKIKISKHSNRRIRI